MAHFAFQVLCEVRKPLENEQTKWNKILCKLICSLLEKDLVILSQITFILHRPSLRKLFSNTIYNFGLQWKALNVITVNVKT